TARRWQCRGGLPFINGAHHFGLCALPGSARHLHPVPAVSDRCTGPLYVTSDIAYYV
ncbi:unnamed protein product, partial [Staurois parvus]